MNSSLTLALRLAVMLVFLVSMPVLAIPQVNAWADRVIFGASKPVPSQANLAVTKSPPRNEVPVLAIARHAPGEATSTPGSGRSDALVARNDQFKAIENPEPSNSIQRLTPTVDALDHERFHSIQLRLQKLGVDYLVLEQQASGESPEFRFHCRIPVPGSAAYSRPFEARDASPLRAMQVVLAEVETWCASHSSTTSSKLR